MVMVHIHSESTKNIALSQDTDSRLREEELVLIISSVEPSEEMSSISLLSKRPSSSFPSAGRGILVYLLR